MISRSRLVLVPLVLLAGLELAGQAEGTPSTSRGGSWRTNPALQGMNIPKTGQNSSVGLMVTRTLVVLGDGQVTAPPGRPRGAMRRAYDKNSGTEVGAVWLPAAQNGSPITYLADGRPYIVVAVSGGIYSGEYVAFALPNAPRSTSLGQQ